MTWAGTNWPCPSCTFVMELKFRKPSHFGPVLFSYSCLKCEAEYLIKVSKVKDDPKKLNLKHVLKKSGKKIPGAMPNKVDNPYGRSDG